MALVFHRAKLDKLESLIGLFSILKKEKRKNSFGMIDVLAMVGFVVHT